MEDIRIIEEARKPLSMHPKKFALWLIMVSIAMMFAAWTSYYLVRQGNGSWEVFDLPDLFWTTTVIILLSSITMHWSYLQARRDKVSQLKVGVGLTLVLGVAFLIGQVLAWRELVAHGNHLTGGNPSESIVYVISGVHGLHIVGGIVFLLIVLASVARNKIHSKNMLRMELCTTYWHFLGILWLYLFVFLSLNR